MLTGLKGQRVLVRYYDAESKRLMMEDFVELLRRSKEVDVEYSLYLRSPAVKYKQDTLIFETILRSFALTECDNC